MFYHTILKDIYKLFLRRYNKKSLLITKYICHFNLIKKNM